MKPTIFAKKLGANDIGKTGSHQAGIHVPKSDPVLLSFFPKLDSGTLNPDTWISCRDNKGEDWRFRFVYYNNKIHRTGGTRNEYRLTHMTAFLNQALAQPGDLLVFTATEVPNHYQISIEKEPLRVAERESDLPDVIRLSGWHRVH